MKNLDDRGGYAVKKSHAFEVVPLDQLAPDPGNVRTHDARSIDGIAASLHAFGAARSVVIDGGGICRAGNGTLAAAAREGFREVLVVEPLPGQLVAVRRSDWSEEEARRYAVADNRLQELSAWDRIGLGTALREFESDPAFDPAAVGFTTSEVAGFVEGLGTEMLAGQGEGAAGEQAPPPAAAAAPKKRFSVVVECRSEAHQRKTAETLRSQGYRVSTAEGYRPRLKRGKKKGPGKPGS